MSESTVWLNSGCLGRHSNKSGAHHKTDLASAALENAYRQLTEWVASWCGVDADRILLTDGTTDACDMALVTRRGIPTLMVHTDLAHEAIRHSIEGGARFFQALSGNDVSVRKVVTRDLFDLMPDQFADELCRRLKVLCGERLSVVVLEHVTSDDGLRIPLNEVIDRLAIALPQTSIIIDGAQAIGVWKPPAGFAGAYIGCFHKYLNGPVGTGFCVLPPALAENALHRVRATQSWRYPAGKEFLPTTDIEKWELCRAAVERFKSDSGSFDIQKRVTDLRRDLLRCLPAGSLAHLTGVKVDYLSHIISLTMSQISSAEDLWMSGFAVKQLHGRIRITIHHELRHFVIRQLALSIHRLTEPDDDLSDCDSLKPVHDAASTIPS